MYKVLIIYCIVANLFEPIYLWIKWKKVLSKMRENILANIFYGEILKLLKRNLIWHALPLLIIFMFANIFLFPYSLIGLFFKTKSEKEAEQKLKDIQQAEKDAKEWLKNEGEWNIR